MSSNDDTVAHTASVVKQGGPRQRIVRKDGTWTLERVRPGEYEIRDRGVTRARLYSTDAQRILCMFQSVKERSKCSESPGIEDTREIFFEKLNN